jgi:hypothetical protein
MEGQPAGAESGAQTAVQDVLEARLRLPFSGQERGAR